MAEVTHSTNHCCSSAEHDTVQLSNCEKPLALSCGAQFAWPHAVRLSQAAAMGGDVADVGEMIQKHVLPAPVQLEP